jgi:hypothetical protein
MQGPRFLGIREARGQPRSRPVGPSSVRRNGRRSTVLVPRLPWLRRKGWLTRPRHTNAVPSRASSAPERTRHGACSSAHWISFPGRQVPDLQVSTDGVNSSRARTPLVRTSLGTRMAASTFNESRAARAPAMYSGQSPSSRQTALGSAPPAIARGHAWNGNRPEETWLRRMHSLLIAGRSPGVPPCIGVGLAHQPNEGTAAHRRGDDDTHRATSDGRQEGVSR